MFNADKNCHTPAFILPNEQVRAYGNLGLLCQEPGLREGKIRRKNPGCSGKKLQPGTALSYSLDSTQPYAFIHVLSDLQGVLRRLLGSYQFQVPYAALEGKSSQQFHPRAGSQAQPQRQETGLG